MKAGNQCTLGRPLAAVEPLENRLCFSVTGLSAAEVAYLKADQSSASLEVAISQMIVSADPNSSVGSFAAKVISDHTKDTAELQSVAASHGLKLPTGITAASDQAIYNAFPKSGSAATLDAAYLATMLQVNVQGITNETEEVAYAATHGSVRRLAEDMLPDDISHLETAKALQGSATGTGLTAIDQDALIDDYSGSSLEISLSLAAQKYAKSAAVKDLASMLITMHTAVNEQLLTLAAKKGFTLPAGVTQPIDLSTQSMVFSHIKSGGYDAAYLKGLAASHAIALAGNAMEIAMTHDKDALAFAESYVPTVVMHLEEAVYLRTGLTPSGLGSPGSMTSTMM